MLNFEQLSVAYFTALAAAMLVVPGLRVSRIAASGVAAATVLIILAATRVLPLDVRFWLAHLYLVLGYWIPAWPVIRDTSSRFERWLAATDAVCRRALEWLPHSLAAAGDAAYLMCYPMVPAAFLMVWMLGDRVDVDRFWIATLGAGFLCYATTPWLAARPPRLLPLTAASASPLARINVALLDRVSHSLITFPSGHVAVAVAIAFGLMPVSGPGALVFAVLAIGIAIGAAAGRYHYVVDVLAGLVAGLAAGSLAVTLL